MDDLAQRKSAIRTRVWDKLEELDVLEDYPRPCHNKIPYFKGSTKAAYNVAKLGEFRRSKVVKINPSLAQMQLRYLVLKHEKILVTPSPSLVAHQTQSSTDLVFCHKIDGSALESNSKKRKASSKAGAVKFGETLLLDWTSVGKVDLVIVGSVAVSTNGVRLGKGHGFAELEWGILAELGVVTKNTVVVTTVHDEQIVDDMPLDLMSAHDLPVDIIVTPTRTINVRQKLNKPMGGVLWDLVDEEKLKDIPILQLIKRNHYQTVP